MFSFDEIMLFTHLFGVFLWLSSIPVAFVLFRIGHKIVEIESLKKVYSMTTYMQASGIIGMLLILISGTIMARGDWFDFTSGHIWLALKQIIFILTFIYGITIMRVVGTKLNNNLKLENVDTQTLISNFNEFFYKDLVIGVLIIINMILATVLRPYL